MTTKKTNTKKKTNGMLNDLDARIENAVTLDELLGKSSPNMFGAVDEDEFSEKIDKMPLVDLHKLATRAGLLPVHDRTVMKKRLRKSFSQYIRSLRPYKMSNKKHFSIGEKETADLKRAKEIMSRGR